MASQNEETALAGLYELRERGYSPDMSDEEMRRAWVDGAPAGVEVAEKSLDKFNGPDGLANLIKRLRHNRSFWDCIVANLGWWAAINFGASIVVFLTLVASGVPWYVAVWLAAAFQSVFTTYIFGQCLANSAYYIGRL